MTYVHAAGAQQSRALASARTANPSDDPVDSAGRGRAARGVHLDPTAFIGGGLAGGLTAGTLVGAIAGLAEKSHFGSRLGRGAGIGAAIGLVGGIGLVAIDRLTGGGVAKAVPPLSMLTTNQLLALAQHPLHPQLGLLSLHAAYDAVRARQDAYGASRGPDAGDDAFRHAYGAALLATRLQKWHASGSATADMVMDVGRAHENDSRSDVRTDPHNYARAMDLHNDEAGIAIAGNGRDAQGHWLTDAQLRAKVFEAMQAGKLEVVRRENDPYGDLQASAKRDLPLSMR